MTKEKKERKKKRQRDWLEMYVFSIMEKSIYEAGMAALNDLFRDWN